MPKVNVQFSDTSETKIIATFGAPQDPIVYPNQALLDTTDARYVAYASPSQQQILQAGAMAAIATGITITSTSTPAVNGTYACDGSTTSDINAEITSILLNSTFADGSSTISWPDTSGALHVFPSTTVFKSFATALASYVSNVRKYAVGVNPSLPSNSITIA